MSKCKMDKKQSVILERFSNNVIKWLELIQSTIEDLNDQEITKVTGNNIETAIVILKKLYKESAGDIMEHFVKGHIHWDMIHKRDLKFVIEEIPKIYGKTQIDIDAITEIPKVYLRMKKEGNYEGKTDETTWPVNQEDMDAQWKYFDAMIIWACRYIKHRQTLKTNDAIDGIIKNINLAKYEKLFNVTYDYGF